MSSIFIKTNSLTKPKNIIFVCNEQNLINKIKTVQNPYLNISFLEEEKLFSSDNILNSFDLIIFDNSSNGIEKFVKFFKSTFKYDINIPVIILEDNISSESISLYKYCNVLASNKIENLDVNLFMLNVELMLDFLYLNKRKEFEDGYFFDMTKELLFKGKTLVKLTKMERNLIKLLAQNSNMLVTYEEISQYVWKGKSFSIFSLRNVVKHIREKTNDSFIKNSSNKGYTITTV